eukprot:scpid33569/ scgid19242/ 
MKPQRWTACCVHMKKHGGPLAWWEVVMISLACRALVNTQYRTARAEIPHIINSSRSMYSIHCTSERVLNLHWPLAHSERCMLRHNDSTVHDTAVQTVKVIWKISMSSTLVYCP